ncbi:DUF4373 domain-containing protein [Terribacillus saccharophilus]|uniref:DUF4373 domain-containing protein n=1 Tax=Terribacillus saccharophilus TaxID=361277 RepID=UPI0038185865
MKEAYYFSHDANARQDEKILMLRADHGWEGYGIYWALVEMMFESKETALHHSKIKGIAVSYNIDMTLLKNVIETCVKEELFKSDGDRFWSETLVRRKEKFLNIRDQKSEAGKKGAAKRWENQGLDGSAMAEPSQSHSGAITENSKGKEIKEKESKENKNIKDLFDHYCSKNIISHKKLSGPMQTAIRARLRDYSFEELKTAIDNYALVFHSSMHWFTHKYPLADFMRDKDVRKFLAESDPINNFSRRKQQTHQQYNPASDAF